MGKWGDREEETRNSDGRLWESSAEWKNDQCNSDPETLGESAAVNFTMRQLDVIFAANRFRCNQRRRKSELWSAALARLPSTQN